MSSKRSFNIEKVIKNFDKKNSKFYVIGIDVGGTNTNSSVAIYKNKEFRIIFSLKFKTKENNSILPIIKKTINYAKENHNIKVDTACISAAGVISKNQTYVKLTNAPWEIDTDEIKKNTSLKNVYLINDFQAVGYGINLLDHKNKEDIVIIREINNHKNYNQTKCVLGAGTGFGKGILIYNKENNLYTPHPSEGGHSDLPVHDNFEKNLLEYLKNKRKINEPLTYEEVLSGRGIKGIYNFLREDKKYDSTDYTKKIDKSKNKASLISKFKNKDKTCKKTFEIFITFFARCAKNFALDTLSKDGVYIAGGIVSKNIDIFTKKDFIEEFENSYRRSSLLKKIPIYAVINYDVSIFGACFACIYNKLLEKKDE